MPRAIDADFFQVHREQYLEQLGSGFALLCAPAICVRNGDADYRYRQESSFYYLTGWEHPEAVALFRPGTEQPYILFVQAKDPAREIWTGRRPGPEGAIRDFGADGAFGFDELAEKLPELVQGASHLHYAFGTDREMDDLLLGAIRKARQKAHRNGLEVPVNFSDPGTLLGELRLRKSEAELTRIREAVSISVDAHLEAMRQARVGIHEYEIEAIIDGTFRSRGGNGPGYTSIVAAGDNATILHYIENDDVVEAGELVLIDAGCEFEYYTADITRTWPVNGAFTPAQRAVYDVVLGAHEAVLALAAPGVPFQDLHDLAVRKLTEGMVRIGLLEGEVDELITEETYKRFYMHKTGHWLGLDVHDVGRYFLDGQSRPLEPGMLFTVEPGIYVAPDDEAAPEQYRGIGVRIEDDVLVVDGGVEVLSARLPREADTIEGIVGSA